MTIKSSWAYHNGRGELRNALQIVADVEEERRQAHQHNLHNLQKEREKARQDREKELLMLWGGLKAGDSLAALGMPNVVIKKKNRKSIISTLGSKWTQREIFNLA